MQFALDKHAASRRWGTHVLEVINWVCASLGQHGGGNNGEEERPAGHGVCVCSERLLNGTVPGLIIYNEGCLCLQSKNFTNRWACFARMSKLCAWGALVQRNGASVEFYLLFSHRFWAGSRFRLRVGQIIVGLGKFGPLASEGPGAGKI